MNVVRVQHIEGLKNCQRHLLSHISISVMVKNKNNRKWNALKTTRSNISTKNFVHLTLRMTLDVMNFHYNNWVEMVRKVSPLNRNAYNHFSFNFSIFILQL